MNIVFYCPKGGVAKTTSCHNFGAALVERGHSVMMFDLDPQRNLAVGTPLNAKQVAKAAKSDECEYSLFDCPPSLSDESKAALQIADMVIIPVQLEYYAAIGLSAILNILHDAQARGHSFEYRILPTMLDRRIKLSVQFEADLRKKFGPLVLTTISRNSAVIQASAHEISVIEHAPRSQAAKDYRAACAQLFEGVEL